MQSLKTVIVHDWLVGIGGAEKVLKSILDLFPSPIFTLVHDQQNQQLAELLGQQIVTSSFLQKLPGISRHYRNCLPLFPYAIEQFDLRDYDVILSSSHAVAKGIKTHSEQLHICYCHTPMRYAWDLYSQYTSGLKGLKRWAAQFFLPRLRSWDAASASRVNHYIANSQFVAKRIESYYQKKADVIYPPVATHLFSKRETKEEFYITVSRLVPYKKIDLIVEAFSAMPDKKLVVIGDGPEEKRVKLKAGKNIELLGFQSDAIVRDLIGKARAFVFAAEEDFGITVVEAQAAGTPVIAYGSGGALETVQENRTGLFFSCQTVESLRDAVNRFERKRDDFIPVDISAHAEQFNEERFKIEYQRFVNQKIQDFYESNHSSRRHRDSSLAPI